MAASGIPSDMIPLHFQVSSAGQSMLLEGSCRWVVQGQARRLRNAGMRAVIN
jgi:hypothetical protein